MLKKMMQHIFDSFCVDFILKEVEIDKDVKANIFWIQPYKSVM